MRDGICAKCHSKDVRFGDNIFGVNIPPVKTPIPVEHYICTACGYIENYIPDIPSLDKLASHLPRVYQLHNQFSR